MLDFSVTFFITVINILVLFFLLRAFLFKPVSKFIQDRKKKIQDDINRAEKDSWDAKKLLEQYESKLAQADADAETILKVAREHAQAEADKIREEGKADAERIAAAARARIENERRAAMALFRAEAAVLVVNAAGRLLKRELAGEEQLRFAREVLDEIE
ncbi:MAG: F0F1 ATP synthase subunit B [Treponema sp.]|jgi:F-type H+-transporting ATPase subunit b|nr:F0F1 ATP synthase subunit B [Treponema sp.]